MSVNVERAKVENAEDQGARRNRATPLLLVVAALGLLGVAGVWWFLRDDAPAEVSLEAATAVLDDGTDESGVSADDTAADDTAADDTAGDAAAGDSTGGSDASGAWTIDTETGEFSYESATGSFVGFRIEEELNGVGATTAVGRTADIAGGITIDDTAVTEAAFDIDLTTITTETSMRDDNVQDALETAQFPNAVFTLTEPIELGDAPATGEAVFAVAIGDMTIHGVTQTVQFDLEAQLVDSTIVIVGSTDITFSDFGVEVPNGGPVIRVDDFGVLELQLLLVR